MNSAKVILLVGIACLTGGLWAQQTTVFTEANLAYKRGEEFYQKGLYGKSRSEYEAARTLLRPANEPQSQMLKTRAELGYAKSAVRLNLPEGENLILDFIRKYRPDPIAYQALIEVANYFFNAKEYEKAINYFSQIPSYELTNEQRAEVKFKMGYSFFVKKKFKEAKNNFREVKNFEGPYFYPTNYYYGLCEFFDGNYHNAINSFKLVERSKQYKTRIPYYIAQIHFAKGDFDKVIAYTEPKLKSRELRHRKEMNQLVGRAYYENGEYEKALPFLEYYAAKSSRLKEEEFYQLGYAQYQTGRYHDASKNFEQLEKVDSELGQFALYYLADSYLKLGKKNSARNAFGAASRMDFDPTVKEDALFNYAKLSYELKFDREALDALQGFDRSSKYYSEAQTLMSKIFLNTRDYEKALAILDHFPDKTPQLKEAYQKVAYFRGQQLFKEDKLDQSIGYFNKSLDVPVNKRYEALATYWLGDIAHQQKKYNESIRYMNQFLTLSKTMRNLPDESSVFTANYLQGYNYLKQKNYNGAFGYFKSAVEGIKRNSVFIRNDAVKNEILADATLRAGDCLFKRNRYRNAARYYNEAINNAYPGFVYAIFQKAIIEGLRGRKTEKILALENLVENNPHSEYTDDALFQLGITYQEMGQLDKSAEPLRELVSRHRHSPLLNTALLRLGLITYNRGNIQKAIEYYKQVFSGNPEEDEAQAAIDALEEIYIQDLNDPDGFSTFLETVPGYNLDHYGRDTLNFNAAESAFGNATYDRAASAFSNYIRKFPNGRNSLLAHYHRGDSYTELMQYSDAFKDYEWVIAKGQSRYYGKALEKAAIIAYNHELDFAKSFDYYSRLEEVANTSDMRFQAQLGALRSAYRIGNASAVSKMAGKVVNNPAASKDNLATANFFLGKMAFDQKEFQTALDAFGEVTKLSDNVQTAEARYLVAYIYYQQRDLETAKQLAVNANKESSNFPFWVAKSVILLSDIFAEQGDLFNAKAALEALIENFDEDEVLIATAKAKLAQLEKRTDSESRLDTRKDSGDFLINDRKSGGG